MRSGLVHLSLADFRTQCAQGYYAMTLVAFKVCVSVCVFNKYVVSGSCLNPDCYLLNKLIVMTHLIQ